MAKYIFKRTLQSLLSVFIVVFVVFLLLRLMPTDGYFTRDDYQNMSEAEREMYLEDIGAVGNPIKLSDSPAEVKRSPLLGEPTNEILSEVLQYSDEEIAAIKSSGATEPPPKKAAAE